MENGQETWVTMTLFVIVEDRLGVIFIFLAYLILYFSFPKKPS